MPCRPVFAFISDMDVDIMFMDDVGSGQAIELHLTNITVGPEELGVLKRHSCCAYDQHVLRSIADVSGLFT